mmetsp:Transcript_9675/g.10747  ORF Transcript_9675/g.10747 Transcript_9675/m.10747 type:complete len:302 (+) Transcript_9675:131-1036(+)|eukprot:CAMPEP_0194131660 /NCGR_PEP_ID=MMETSP0152-20130528/2389_1 /TAXON_ID=1049557 /ORGANISM="Thalassiothrix antarctica, Strain L6-D1" /LENGTH=301 /DNA_ID=CAMNT_0038826517 /DNA_START=77 /DNA_END=982 /DNA_ORIENTATION=-
MNTTRDSEQIDFGENEEESVNFDLNLSSEDPSDRDVRKTMESWKRQVNTEEDLEEEIPMSFPQRLMEILSNEEHADVIAWLPHGKGFIMYKKKKLAAQVLPKYFKQSKFTSFTRKLNRWGFVRVTRGPETGAYYHQFFQRGNLRLCMQMSCQSSKATVMQVSPFGNSLVGSTGLDSPGVLSLPSHDSNDLAKQNQIMIHQQLQQLQLQQLELQQLQLQQQQQLQAAEFLRQALAKQNGEITPEENNANNIFLQNLKETDLSMLGQQTLLPTRHNSMLPIGQITSMGEPFRTPNNDGRAWAA